MRKCLLLILVRLLCLPLAACAGQECYVGADGDSFCLPDRWRCSPGLVARPLTPKPFSTS